MRIVYMGTPEFAVAPLNEILKAGYDVVGVVTTPDKQKGRGLQVAQSALKQFVIKYNEETKRKIPIFQPEKLRDDSFIEALRELNADLFIVVAFRMLPESVWQLPKLGTFNLHASLLPKYRGAAPINWAIINGEKESGVTTFMIDHQIDTGNILLQEKCLITENETAETLHDKLMNIGSLLVIKTIEGLKNNTIAPTPQQGEITNAPKLNRENCKINWSDSADKIKQLVRGLSPYPAAYSNMVKIGDYQQSIEFKIYDCGEIVLPKVDFSSNNNNENKIGEIQVDKNGRLFVRCIDNMIEITELKMSGKKKMKATDFIRGFRDIESYRFE